MKYFLHDCNALNDEKISELVVAHGYEGLGLFYSVLEKIGAQEKPVKTTVLKHQLNVGKKLDKCWSFMEQIGLISSKNGETFNERILSYSEKYQVKKEKNRERILQWREKQVDTGIVTCYEQPCNTPKLNEVNKVNEVNDIRANALVAKATDEPDQKILKKEYDELVDEFTGKDLKEVVIAVKNFIQIKKPLCIEPYQDYWNLFAKNYNLAEVRIINDERKRKFKTRVREPGFDFLKLLDKIKLSKQLKGIDTRTDWKVTFDWVLENQSNYVKILEGNYDGV